MVLSGPRNNGACGLPAQHTVRGYSVQGNLRKWTISNRFQSPACTSKSSLDSHRFCLYSCFLVTRYSSNSWFLSLTINSMAQSPTNSGPPPPNPHTTLPSWMPPVGLQFLLDARSKFSVSINHWVSNGMLPFRMRPITEGAAVSAVGEAALIAWIHSQLWSHCRCLLIVVIIVNGGG